MPSKKINYRQLNDELESILTKLQEPDIDIDEAAAAYQRGREITKQLEDYLKKAENTVKKVKGQAKQ